MTLADQAAMTGHDGRVISGKPVGFQNSAMGLDLGF
jgi:hypothetical protein